MSKPSERLTLAGLPEGASDSQRRRHRTANIIGLLSIAVTLPTIPVFLAEGHPAARLAAISSTVAVVFYALGLAIVAGGRPRAGWALLTFAVIANVANDTWLLGTGCGTQFYFIAIGTGVMLMWSWEEAGFRLALAVVGFVAFVAALALVPVTPAVGPPLRPAFASAIYLAQATGAYLVAFGCAYYAVTTTERTESALERERTRSERLLLNVLPASIARRLKDGETRLADSHAQATVLFADIAGFTPMSATLTPDALVDFLGQLFTEFDALVSRHGLEKIKTIGDAYMAAAGVPYPRSDHAQAAVQAGLEMIACAERIFRERNVDLALRVGIDSGPVTAGVIGTHKFSYDLWGDTVNAASRMESHGVPGRVQITTRVREALAGAFPLEARGGLEIKGKGRMETYLVGAGGIVDAVTSAPTSA